MRHPVLDQPSLNSLAELEGKTPEQIDQFAFEAGLTPEERLRRLALKIRSEQVDPGRQAKQYWSRSLQAQLLVDANGDKVVDCVLGYREMQSGELELVYGLVTNFNLAGVQFGFSQVESKDYPFDTPEFDNQSKKLFISSADDLRRAGVEVKSVLQGGNDYAAYRVAQILQFSGVKLQLQGPAPAYRSATYVSVPSGDYFLDQEQQAAYAGALRVIEGQNLTALRASGVQAEIACGAALLSKAIADFAVLSATNEKQKKANKKDQATLAADFNKGAWKDVVSIVVKPSKDEAVLKPNYSLSDVAAAQLNLANEWQAVKTAREKAAAVDFVASVALTRDHVQVALKQVKQAMEDILKSLNAQSFLDASYRKNPDFIFVTEAVLRDGRIGFVRFGISDKFINDSAPALQNANLTPAGRAQVYAVFRAELKNQVSDYLTARHHEAEERKRLAALPKTQKANVLLEKAKEAYFGKHEKRRAKGDDLGSYHSAFMKRLISQLKEQGETELSLQALALAIAPKVRQNRHCLFGDRGRTVLRENALRDASVESLNADKYGTDAALQVVISALRK